MKRILILLVVFGCCLYSVTADKLCEPSKRPYTIPDEEFCDKFVRCENSTATVVQCEDGLLFDPDMEKCDMPNVVKCGTRTKTQTPSPTLNCPRMNGMFPVEETCNQFYHCTDGRHTLITCPEGVIFDIIAGACVHPDLSTRKNCSASQILHFECPNRKHRFKLLKFGDHDRLPHPESCRMFIMCLMTGEPRLGGCSLGQVFNPTNGRCDLPKNVKGCEDFYGPEVEEDADDDVPDFGSVIEDGVVVRKQKVIEEEPAPFKPVADETRKKKVVKKTRAKVQN